MRSDATEVLKHFYGMTPPSQQELSAREKAVNVVKKKYADKMRCNTIMPKLAKPL